MVAAVVVAAVVAAAVVAAAVVAAAVAVAAVEGEDELQIRNLAYLSYCHKKYIITRFLKNDPYSSICLQTLRLFTCNPCFATVPWYFPHA